MLVKTCWSSSICATALIQMCGNVDSVLRHSLKEFCYRCTFVPRLPKSHTSADTAQPLSRAQLTLESMWLFMWTKSHSNADFVGVHSLAPQRSTIISEPTLERNHSNATNVFVISPNPPSSADIRSLLKSVQKKFKRRVTFGSHVFLYMVEWTLSKCDVIFSHFRLIWSKNKAVQLSVGQAISVCWVLLPSVFLRCRTQRLHDWLKEATFFRLLYVYICWKEKNAVNLFYFSELNKFFIGYLQVFI